MLTKEERLELLKYRHQVVLEKEELVFGEIPVSQFETEQTVFEMDSFTEHQRDLCHAMQN